MCSRPKSKVLETRKGEGGGEMVKTGNSRVLKPRLDVLMKLW